MQASKKPRSLFSRIKKALRKFIKQRKSDNEEPESVNIPPYMCSYAAVLHVLQAKHDAPLQPLIQPIYKDLSHTSFVDLHALFAPPQPVEALSLPITESSFIKNRPHHS